MKGFPAAPQADGRFQLRRPQEQLARPDRAEQILERRRQPLGAVQVPGLQSRQDPARHPPLTGRELPERGQVRGLPALRPVQSGGGVQPGNGRRDRLQAGPGGRRDRAAQEDGQEYREADQGPEQGPVHPPMDSGGHQDGFRKREQGSFQIMDHDMAAGKENY